jgi:hypothetical protein
VQILLFKIHKMESQWLGEGKFCAAGCGKVITTTNANFKPVLSAEGLQPPACVSYPDYLGRAVCLTCGAMEELMMQREVLQLRTLVASLQSQVVRTLPDKKSSELREQVDSFQSPGMTKKSSWADRLSIVGFSKDEEQRNHNRPS